MSQLNVHVTPEFEQALAEYMRIRGIRTKSEAVRRAVEEGLAREIDEVGPADFESWIGLGLRAPENPRPRFESDRDLWES